MTSRDELIGQPLTPSAIQDGDPAGISYSVNFNEGGGGARSGVSTELLSVRSPLTGSDIHLLERIFFVSSGQVLDKLPIAEVRRLVEAREIGWGVFAGLLREKSDEWIRKNLSPESSGYRFFCTKIVTDKNSGRDTEAVFGELFGRGLYLEAFRVYSQAALRLELNSNEMRNIDEKIFSLPLGRIAEICQEKTVVGNVLAAMGRSRKFFYQDGLEKLSRKLNFVLRINGIDDAFVSSMFGAEDRWEPWKDDERECLLAGAVDYFPGAMMTKDNSKVPLWITLFQELGDKKELPKRELLAQMLTRSDATLGHGGVGSFYPTFDDYYRDVRRINRSWEFIDAFFPQGEARDSLNLRERQGRYETLCIALGEKAWSEEPNLAKVCEYFEKGLYGPVEEVRQYLELVIPRVDDQKVSVAFIEGVVGVVTRRSDSCIGVMNLRELEIINKYLSLSPDRRKIEPLVQGRIMEIKSEVARLTGNEV